MNIVVIASNFQDFKDFGKSLPYSQLNISIRCITHGEVKYHYGSCADALRGFLVSGIVVTQLGRKRKDIGEILNIAVPNMLRCTR